MTELADTLAKQALDLPNIVNNVAFEAREVNEEIDKYIDKMWQNKWDRCETGRFNKQLNVTVNHSIKYENSCRAKEVKITRLRLGKCRLNKYLHDI